MKKNDFNYLVDLAKILRSDEGCPWDREQTIASMLKYTEDEVHELRQAIENGDHENLKEELGDVLFQLIMIAQIAKEKGYFDINQVLKALGDKIVSRHSWVFGEDKGKVNSSEEALVLWKKNKSKEVK